MGEQMVEEKSFEITGVKIKKVKKEGNLKAWATITINDSIVMRDIRVLNGEKGLFVGMPGRKRSDGKYSDTVYIKNSSIKEDINKAILEMYETTPDDINDEL